MEWGPWELTDGDDERTIVSMEERIAREGFAHRRRREADRRKREAEKEVILPHSNCPLWFAHGDLYVGGPFLHP
jgi:hypothetical protein